MTTLNPPRQVRAALYVLTAIGTPVVAYLNARGVLGADEVTLWSAVAAVVGGLAALNTRGSTDTVRRIDGQNDPRFKFDSDLESWYDSSADESADRGATDLVTVAAAVFIVCAVVWLVLVAR